MKISAFLADDENLQQLHAAHHKATEEQQTAKTVLKLIKKAKFPKVMGVYCSAKKPCTLANVYRLHRDVIEKVTGTAYPHERAYLIDQPTARRSPKELEGDTSLTALGSGVVTEGPLGFPMPNSRYGRDGTSHRLEADAWFATSRKVVFFDCNHLARVPYETENLIRHADAGEQSLMINGDTVIS